MDGAITLNQLVIGLSIVGGLVGIVGAIVKIRATMRKEAEERDARITEPIQALTKAVTALDAKLQAELYPLHGDPLAVQVKSNAESIAELHAGQLALQTAIASNPALIQAIGDEMAKRLTSIEAGLKLAAGVSAPPQHTPSGG
jgi:hypothetical protein